jgi:hypothetical protein
VPAEPLVAPAVPALVAPPPELPVDPPPLVVPAVGILPLPAVMLPGGSAPSPQPASNSAAFTRMTEEQNFSCRTGIHVIIAGGVWVRDQLPSGAVKWIRAIGRTASTRSQLMDIPDRRRRVTSGQVERDEDETFVLLERGVVETVRLVGLNRIFTLRLIEPRQFIDPGTLPCFRLFLAGFCGSRQIESKATRVDLLP